MSYRTNKVSRNDPDDPEKLDTKITIQTQTPGKNETSGEATRSPSVFATPWASVRPWQGREFSKDGQLSAEVTTRFQIRHKTGLKATMTILYDSKTYEIFRIEPIGRRDRINIYAKAREAE